MVDVKMRAQHVVDVIGGQSDVGQALQVTRIKPVALDQAWTRLVIPQAGVDQDIVPADPQEPAVDRHGEVAAFRVIMRGAQPVLVRLYRVPIEVRKPTLHGLAQQIAVEHPPNFGASNSTDALQEPSSFVSSRDAWETQALAS